MSIESCGYRGHVCSSSDVQFISRYRNQNDYCVAGRRISVSDDGTVSDRASAAEREAILMFELSRYAWYLHGHAARKNQYPNDWFPNVLPFDAGIGKLPVTDFHSQLTSDGARFEHVSLAEVGWLLAGFAE